MDKLNDGCEKGKAFVIYPKNNCDFEKIAKDLNCIILKNNLQKNNTHIESTNELGHSGRIFYRYEYSSGDYKDIILNLKNTKDSINYRRYYDENRLHNHYLAYDMSSDDDPFINLVL